MNPTDTELNDSLTGALNRKAILEKLSRMLADNSEQEIPFSIALVDIDYFKAINDRFGHAAGDVLLQEVVSVCTELAGEVVLVSRYGGDEFMLLFPHTERELAFLTLERIRAKIEAREHYGAGEGAYQARVTITAGLASFPIDAKTENELLRKADMALYRAKATGRNTVRLAYEERMVPKTTHFTMTQLERLSKLAEQRNMSEAELLREAMDDLLVKYHLTEIES